MYGSYLNDAKGVAVGVGENNIVCFHVILPVDTTCAKLQQPLHFFFLVRGKQVYVVAFWFFRGDGGVER